MIVVMMHLDNIIPSNNHQHKTDKIVLHAILYFPCVVLYSGCMDFIHQILDIPAFYSLSKHSAL
jgi:hypothetical protein